VSSGWGAAAAAGWSRRGPAFPRAAAVASHLSDGANKQPDSCCLIRASYCCAGSATGSSLVVMSKGTPYTQQSYKVSGEADMRAGGRAGSEAGRRAGCISLMRALFCKPCAWPSAPCIRHGLFHQAAALTLVVLAPLVCLPGCLAACLAACLQTPSPSSGSTRSGRRASSVGGCLPGWLAGWLAGRSWQCWRGWLLPASWAVVGKCEPLVQSIVRQAL
jgi:hypothetical protein